VDCSTGNWRTCHNTFASLRRIPVPLVSYWAYRSEYQGKIVDKWAKYHESEEGSRPSFTFMVEQDDGQRFPVAVSSDIYQKGKVGMRINKTEARGVEVLGEETEGLKNRKY
jgi:hypothetical protein